jgi:hypothetical protein
MIWLIQVNAVSIHPLCRRFDFVDDIGVFMWGQDITEWLVVVEGKEAKRFPPNAADDTIMRKFLDDMVK